MEIPPEDNPLLPRPALIVEPLPVSSFSLPSRSPPPVTTTDPFFYVPRCPRSLVPCRLRSYVPLPDASPGSVKREANNFLIVKREAELLWWMQVIYNS
ncbi:hypothetical protein F0562_027373 [Nyssa sinensis]|uniref:Uncharacterized protein n=1 Tax=Nyssa sinensis TaxID=561372 RepID=A0A5J5B8G9_9ASTE|nr:hypothetical protein F0562_027373 [Nyssa sinensis]